MKTFTRCDAEHHDPATRYVLADEAEALRAERNELARLRDRLVVELEYVRAELESAPTYPVENPANPLLAVESGGIRYVLEVFSDEDGDIFEVKSATPTEELQPGCFAHAAVEHERVTALARIALRQWREEHQCDAD